jgi:hypothetical protein
MMTAAKERPLDRDPAARRNPRGLPDRLRAEPFENGEDAITILAVRHSFQRRADAFVNRPAAFRVRVTELRGNDRGDDRGFRFRQRTSSGRSRSNRSVGRLSSSLTNDCSSVKVFASMARITTEEVDTLSFLSFAMSVTS